MFKVLREDVTDCEKTNVATERICRADCTSNNLCIAYGYGGLICSMIQSSDICPVDYELYNNTLATTASDIVKIEDDSFVCYIKESGNYLEILKTITPAILFRIMRFYNKSFYF